MHPGFLLESDAHRNMAFTIYHCYHTPKLSIDTITEKNLGDGLREITAVISNSRLMPTHSSQDLKYKIERPDFISIEGVKAVAGMVVQNADLNINEEQETNLARISGANMRGLSSVRVRGVVAGGGKALISVDSRKGGKVSRQQ